MNNIFLQLTVILGLVSALGYIISHFRFPIVIAYLLAGVILSLSHLFGSNGSSLFTFLPDLGIAFVLFLIGMELDLRELKALGKPIIFTSLVQITMSALAGFSISHLFGFNLTQSFLLGICLSFSSTVVIVKMLLEKKDLASLYGKLSVGILLIEDIVAIAVLMFISLGKVKFAVDLQSSLPFIIMLLKAAVLFFFTFVLAKFFLERLFDSVAKSIELLFLSAITWCFLFTSAAQLLGFSVTIGAFLAGITLASSPYHYHIQGKIKPLRDFFVTLFFVYLGTQINLGNLEHFWPAVIIFVLYALTIKPIIFLLVLSIFGFRKHTLFNTSVNLSQISEFSMIIVLLGVQKGILPNETLSIMATVVVVSIMLSSILMSSSKSIYKLFSPVLPFFELKENIHVFERKIEESLSDHIIIIGAHRVGRPIVNYLKRNNIPFVVMDFNPHIVEELRGKNINVIYGDITDPDILDSLQLDQAKLVISTATDIADNELLIAELKRRGVKAKVVARALDDNHSKKLKEMGADYVILPEQVSGDYLVTQLKNHWPDVKFPGLD